MKKLLVILACLLACNTTESPTPDGAGLLAASAPTHIPAPHKLGAALDGSVANSTFTLVTPIGTAFTGDTPITGVQIQNVSLDFDAQTATVIVTAIGGPASGIRRVIVLNVPPAEMTTLQGQLKTGVSGALGVTFQ